jgi:hypothetical protein
VTSARTSKVNLDIEILFSEICPAYTQHKTPEVRLLVLPKLSPQNNNFNGEL